jgi:hypothetical protein
MGEIINTSKAHRFIEAAKDLALGRQAPEEVLLDYYGRREDVLPYEHISMLTDLREPILPEAAEILNRKFFPTRLIDVTPLSTSEPQHLCLGSECIKADKYAALSHYWGQGYVKDIPETTLETLNTRFSGIPTISLPETFREAIEVCRAVGVRYSWIDSLCIVQNSLGDWEKESATMGGGYANAYFTIAATGAANSTKGLFLKRVEAPGERCICNG